MVWAKRCPVLIFHSDKEVEWRDGIVVEDNHLKDNWHDVAWEKQAGPLMLVKDGKREVGYAVHPYGMSVKLIPKDGKPRIAGITLDLFEDVTLHPWKFDKNGNCTDEVDTEKIVKIHFEGAIGKATSADIIEKGLDLVGSNKKTLLGILIGLALGTFVLAPMLRQMFG